MGWFAGRVFFVFVWLSGGSDPRSARAGAVETPVRTFLEKLIFTQISLHFEL